ncbi:MAG: hypothetical protein ACOYBK_02275 [Bilifractor sp.]|jgi:hypothetical protein|nr:hypothetical protein [Lachnospiraceae bacterium]
MTFHELQELVKKKGYGTAMYGNVNGEPVYLSRGVREAFLNDEDEIQPIINSVIAFQGGDYGTAAEKGKTSTEGHEYGRYDLGVFSEEQEEDTAIWIHRDGAAIIVYFHFER